jgi:hypothetical protein
MTFGSKMEKDQVQYVLNAGFGLHDWANLQRCHELRWTPFRAFFIWLERKFHRASNGTGLISKFYLCRRKTPKQVYVQNLSGWCITVFWVVAPCIVSEPWGCVLGLEHDPHHVQFSHCYVCEACVLDQPPIFLSSEPRLIELWFSLNIQYF